MIASIKKHFEKWIIAVIILFLQAGILFESKLLIAFPFLIIVGFIFLYISLINKTLLLYILAFSIPLSIPLSIIEGPTLSFPSEVIVGFICIYTIATIVLKKGIDKKIFYHPITIFLLIEILWMFVTVYYSELRDISLKRVMVKICYVSVYYFAFLELFKNIENIKKIYALYVAGFCIPLIYTIYKHAELNFTSHGAILACQPFYNDHTIYGAVIAMLIPFIIYAASKKYDIRLFRLFLFFLFAVFCLALFFSYSRAAWISLLAAFIFYLSLKARLKLSFMITILVLVVVIAYQYQSDIYEVLIRSNAISNKEEVSQHIQSITNIQSDVSNAERINRWKCAWRMFEDKPFTGFGPGTYQFYYGQYQIRTDMTRISTYEGNRGHAHSEYLNYLSETGLPGLILFLLLIFFSVKTGLQLVYQNTNDEVKKILMFILPALITFYIHSFFNGFIEIDKMAMLVFCSLAAITSIDIYHSEKKRRKPTKKRRNRSSI